MAVTSADGLQAPATKRRYAIAMQLAARDLLIVRLVATFSQLTSAHVDALVFNDLASRTPCQRALRRLVRDRLLSRITRRLPGGAKGGSPQYVYQLGADGWHLFNRGKYRPMRAVNYHTLAVADTYVQAVRAQQQGELTVTAFDTDVRILAAGVEIRPDLRARAVST